MTLRGCTPSMTVFELTSAHDEKPEVFREGRSDQIALHLLGMHSGEA